MADNEQYYYMRLKENFFESNELTLLESMQDGYLYSNILLKLYLRSLRNNGKLMLNDRIPYSPQMIATITRHQVGTVEKALQLFQDLALIEVLNNGAIFMMDLQNFVGKSSTEADRKREAYNRVEEEKRLLLGEISENSTPEKNKEEQNKNKIKEKEEILCALFDDFYSCYPHKVNKANAKKAFIKLNPSPELVEDMKKAVSLQYGKVEKKDMQFIPHPSTWINGRRWEDEVTDFMSDEEKRKLSDAERIRKGLGG